MPGSALAHVGGGWTGADGVMPVPGIGQPRPLSAMLGAVLSREGSERDGRDP